MGAGLTFPGLVRWRPEKKGWYRFKGKGGPKNLKTAVKLESTGEGTGRSACGRGAVWLGWAWTTKKTPLAPVNLKMVASLARHEICLRGLMLQKIVTIVVLGRGVRYMAQMHL